MGFNFSSIEKKWQMVWEKERIYSTPSPKHKPKIYTLVMFPYPSGAGLHTGHVRVYTGGDVLARFFRMKGYAVLNPMGWDAFGLPAENRAIKEKTTPQKIVPKNIANFKRQMKMLGFSYDWEREFSTTDPVYYRFTQWLFIQFFKMGLLYKKNMPVYFCPFCKTGLAEEEVLPDGTHERCHNPITRKMLPQWVFRITDYAESLLESLSSLDWPEGIKKMQENWIGKSEGTEVKFKVQNQNFKVDEIRVFTTRVDTIFGVTALVLAPEHPLVEEILKSDVELPNKRKIKLYVEKAKQKLDLVRTDLSREKTGVFTGLYAKHPLTGEEIPIWIADYVLGFYGEGAVMLVPAHDERDFEFAKKYGIKVKVVIVPEESLESKVQNLKLREAFVEYGILVNSGKFSGLKSEQAIKKITEYLEKKGLGKRKTQYKLRDWIFSRQRYWGEPIPMVYCEKCAAKKISFWDLPEGKEWLKELEHNNPKLYKTVSEKIKKIKTQLYGWFPLREKDLPLKLPEVENYQPTGTGESPLASLKEWVETSCPVCGGKARRETDTMPNWAGSCWYFLAFTFWPKVKAMNVVQSSKSKQNLFEIWNFELRDSLKTWLPVDWYLGGAEHAVLHLLYSRFWMHALYDFGLVPVKEPFLRLRNVGMVLAEDGRKMSKSFGNVINPDDVVAEFGADALRVYEMFMAPFDQEIAWSTAALRGVARFLNRVWQIFNSSDNLTNKKEEEDEELVVKLHKTIDKVTNDITDVKFNTAIAAMMEFLNSWTEKKASGLSKKIHVENAKKFLKLLAPFAPFLTEEIWREVFKERVSIHLSSWPEVEEKFLRRGEIILPVQVNGRLRATLRLSDNELDEEVVVKKALSLEKIKKYIAGRDYRVVYRKGKILNFVVKL